MQLSGTARTGSIERAYHAAGPFGWSGITNASRGMQRDALYAEFSDGRFRTPGPQRRPQLPPHACMRGADLKAHAFGALQICNDAKEFAGRRIATRAEHLVQSLDVDFRILCQLGKSDCGVDVIAQ